MAQPELNRIFPPEASHFSEDSRRFFTLLRRGWLTLALGAAGCVGLALIYLLIATPLYESTARLLVLQQGGRPLNVANINDPSRPFESNEDTIPTHLSIARSHVVVARAIEK